MNQYIIGVDLGGTNIKLAIFNNQFDKVIEKTSPTGANQGPEYVLGEIISKVQQLISEAEILIDEIACMGIGIPGLLDPQEGISNFSPNFVDWNNIHVVNTMNDHFPFPTFIDNDVRVNLYGEWRFGRGIGMRNFVLLTLGTGLGSGIVVDGHVLYGQTSSVGEIGHMNMYREGRPCKCGSSGCLGRYVSAIGMVNTFLEKLRAGRTSIVQLWVGLDLDKITAEMISRAYDENDPLAIEVMHETATLLGFGLSNVINLFNPEMIIIGGGMSAAGDRLLSTVRETINQHALALSRNSCTIEVAQLGSKAGMIGAAYYAYELLRSTT